MGFAYIGDDKLARYRHILERRNQKCGQRLAKVFGWAGLCGYDGRVFALKSKGRTYRMMRLNTRTGNMDAVIAFPDTVRAYIRTGTLYILPWLGIDDLGRYDSDALMLCGKMGE